jgi:riboflavin synthase
MFTGIIEEIGIVESVIEEKGNIHFVLSTGFTSELKIDQSLAHNGVCLTVVKTDGHIYTVTAIAETLAKTNLKSWKRGTVVNLERCMQLNGRLDGHIVQGHVDTTGICSAIEDQYGSWKFTISYNNKEYVSVEKGSITINGVSLTVVDSKENEFSVCIIPYTFEHTNFSSLKVGDEVNLEFDIIGKYVAKLLNVRLS